MANPFRAMAITALITCGLPAQAIPVPVSLDFTAEGVEADNLIAPVNVRAVAGLKFIGSPMVYTNKLLGGGLPFSGGFIFRSGKSFSIDVDQADSTYQFDQLGFDWASGNQGASVEIFNTDGTTISRGDSGGAFFLSHVAVNLTLGLIDRIEFRSNGDFGIDNLNLSHSPSGGGSVPEPAGLALVALALTGAGVATKRRKLA